MTDMLYDNMRYEKVNCTVLELERLRALAYLVPPKYRDGLCDCQLA